MRSHDAVDTYSGTPDPGCSLLGAIAPNWAGSIPLLVPARDGVARSTSPISLGPRTASGAPRLWCHSHDDVRTAQRRHARRSR